MNEKTPTGGMAFPGFEYTYGHGAAKRASDGWEYYQNGMTLRDYFAAKALQGLLSNRSLDYGQAVNYSYNIADRMLERREK